MMIKLLCIFFFLLILGCKRNNVEPEFSLPSVINVERIQARIDFPDTIYVNQKYDGEILFESHYDSITKVFTNEDKKRYVFVSLALTNRIDYDFNYLKTIVNDTFGAIDNRKIPIYNVSFDYEGVFFIDGIINDAVMINLNQKGEKGEDLGRWLEDEVRVTKKVIVVNKDASE
ncbi:hypothetical protein [Flavobacterium sp. JP2137]|uniref:hypothetical protein n=1 Tax=Flavobacterium sp. JP2137 TaxID=3414510 RepID=UPI003D3015D1